MRSNHDCIMTSSSSVIADNSKLTCRIDGLEDRSPSRIILDNRLKMPIDSNIIKDADIIRWNTYSAILILIFLIC